MTKSELQQGLVVEVRCGEFYIVCGNAIVGNDGWVDINSYLNDLTIIYNAESKYTIVAVYENITNDIGGFSFKTSNSKYLKLLWRRVEKAKLPTLTTNEVTILSVLKDKYEYIGRDFYGGLQAGDKNPIAKAYTTLFMFSHIFDGIEVDETYSIQELLEANKGE